MKIKTTLAVAVLVLGFVARPSPAAAQDNVSGHIGFVLPWVTHESGQNTTLSDRFTIGFPIGVTFKGAGRANLDLEMVPAIHAAKDNGPQQVTLTIDPGVVWGLGGGVAAGVRVAFDVDSSQWGFIPLINKSWAFHNQSGLFKAFFVEIDVPIKFNRPGDDVSTTPITFATHFGLGF